MSNDSNRDAIENALRREVEGWRNEAPPAGSTCVDAETLATWAEGALPAVQAAEVEAHLADCARCQEMAAAFSMTEPAAAVSAPAAMPAAAPRLNRWWLPLAGGAIAATLLLIAVMRRDDVVLPATVPPSPQNFDARAATTGGAAGAPESTTARVEPSSPKPEKKVETRIGPAPATSAQGSTSATRATAPDPLPVFAPPQAAAQAPPPPPAAAPPPPPRPAPVFAPPPAAAQAPPPPPPAIQPPTQLPVTALPGVPVIPSPKPLTLQPSQSRIVQDTRESRAFSFDSATPVVEFASPSLAAAGGGGRGGRGGGGSNARLTAASTSPVTRWRFTRPSSKLERSTDDGLSWETIDLTATPIVIAAGAAPSRTTCWLVGRGGVVLRSTDGLTFIRVSFPETLDLVAITVTDALTVTVTAIGGRQFTTTDGGVTWREVRYSP